MKVQEVIDTVNNNEEVFVDLWSLTDEDVLEENDIYLDLGECVLKLPGEVHRWYTEATKIFKCDDGYVGITGFDYGHGDSVYSEDCCCYCHAEEYEEFTMISYRPKKLIEGSDKK